MTAPIRKRELRDALRTRVAGVSIDEKFWASGVIRGHIADLAHWRAARVVMVYAGDETEPDVDYLIPLGVSQRKTMCVARIDWQAGRMWPAAVDSTLRLVWGRNRIRVPDASCPDVPPDRVDLVVVPGVGFDAAGGRLGRGGGFYDRFLAGDGAGGLRACVVGAGFAASVAERVPMEAHDRKMDAVVTEAGVLVCGVKEERA